MTGESDQPRLPGPDDIQTEGRTLPEEGLTMLGGIRTVTQDAAVRW